MTLNYSFSRIVGAEARWQKLEMKRRGERSNSWGDVG